MLRDDPHVGKDRDEIGVAVPAGHDVEVEMRLHSGAGHDAQVLALLTETGMIFIPSRDGVSHSPREFSDWDRCVDGANVLLRAALKLAEGEA